MTRRPTLSRILSAAAVICALAGGAAWAEDTARRITVSGEGQVEAAPDMATITLGVTNEAREAKAAMEATSDAVARVLERLSSLGIAPRDLQTRELSLSPVWSDRGAAGEERRRITGFVASNTVLVRVRDLTALGGILDAVISDGANDFNGLRFGIQEPDPLMDAARRRAVADAMAQAELLAEAAGVELGPVMSISAHGGGRPAPMAEAMRSSAAGVPVAAGEVTVSANVSMVFAIAE